MIRFLVGWPSHPESTLVITKIRSSPVLPAAVIAALKAGDAYWLSCTAGVAISESGEQVARRVSLRTELGGVLASPVLTSILYSQPSLAVRNKNSPPRVSLTGLGKFW